MVIGRTQNKSQTELRMDDLKNHHGQNYRTGDILMMGVALGRGRAKKNAKTRDNDEGYKYDIKQQIIIYRLPPLPPTSPGLDDSMTR